MHYVRWHRGERQASACSADGCTKPSLTDSRCQKHDAIWRALGTNAAINGSCSMQDCPGSPASAGLCSAHYTRWRRGGSPDVRTRPKVTSYQGALCSIEDCPDPAEKRGWCDMHYRRWQRQGDPNVTKLERTRGDLLPDALCVVCNTDPIMPGSRRYCSVRCMGRFARSKRPKPPLPVQTCVDCGITFQRTTRKGASRGPLRCPPCADLHHKAYNAALYRSLSPEKLAEYRKNSRQWTKDHPEYGRAVQQRRRAQKYQAPFEKFLDAEIFERDGWACQLCMQPVDPDLRWPDPFSASLDHITPLSKGGHHLRSNCQLAHLRCNIKKADSLIATPEAGVA